MGKISEVFYEAIDTKDCSLMESGEFYYHYNLMGINSMFTDDYERYEQSQIFNRNKLIGAAMKRGELPRHPKMDTTIFGVSSLKNRAVIVTEY